MNFQSYLNYFTEILESPQVSEPYNDPAFIEYTKLNLSRMNRWIKTGQLIDGLITSLKKIDKKQTWIVLTEPWCGDAAHIVPFIELMAKMNHHISIAYELRDSAPFRIDQYLTNGSKAIPILIVKDEQGKDIFKWGPRPQNAQGVFKKLAEEGADHDVIKLALQQWYNQDKGLSMQQELVELFEHPHLV